jgi:uncharacterized membrane protein
MIALLLFPIGWGAVWILVIALIVLVARSSRTTDGDAAVRAIRVLEERYARGEITRDDFLERRDVLAGKFTRDQGTGDEGDMR